MAEVVLVTGISGYIAQHVALELLKAGFYVRGTVREFARGEAVRATLEKHGGDVHRVEFVEADLGSEEGWVEAARGCTYLQHLASPFPIRQPKGREDLVPAARDGTMRVLQAAESAGVLRMVVTSSVAAMMYRADRPRTFTFSEEDWTDPEWSKLSPYLVSKTRAELAAWEWADRHGRRQDLAVVNPGFVLGPSLDGRSGTSLEVIKLILEGAYPAVPPIHFAIVDVRDVARIQVEAMRRASCGGRRLLAAGSTRSMAEMGKVLKAEFPDRARKTPTRELPGFLVKLMSSFDRSLKTVLPDLGVIPNARSDYVTELTGVSFRSPEESIKATAASLIEHELV